MAVVVIIIIVAPMALKQYTKQFSPETTVRYSDKGYDLSVTYSAPSKKNRVIFGGLVPYDQVWRTGANEPTMFSTNKDLKLGDGILPAGTYSIWTIPQKETWTVMFNNGDYSWGVNMDGEPQYDAAYDVVKVAVAREQLPTVVENFTIAFEAAGAGVSMLLKWDKDQVSVGFDQ